MLGIGVDEFVVALLCVFKPPHDLHCTRTRAHKHAHMEHVCIEDGVPPHGGNLGICV